MNEVPLAALLAPYAHFCVGSLPYSEPLPAVEFVLSHPLILPFWPELPSRPAERMLTRAERTLRRGWSGYTRGEAAGLYALVEAIKVGGVSAPLIKCQLLGPLSFALYSRELRGAFEDRLRTALEHCVRQVEWQHGFLHSPGRALLFVADEPGFSRWQELEERQRAAA